MAKFNIGDRVYLRESSTHFGANKTNPSSVDVYGTITMISCDDEDVLDYHVYWDADYSNDYAEHDLSLAGTKDEKTNMSKQITKQLAKIRSASLNILDRGILTFYIGVDYEEGCSQNVGGLILDTYNSKTKEREGTAYGCEMIRQLLLVLDVDDLNKAVGKTIWVHGEGQGLMFTPVGISRLNVDGGKTLMFDDVLTKFKEVQQ